jgi:hypothetical protein
MTGHSFAPVIGSSKDPVSQFPTFGVFVLRKIGHSIPASISENQMQNALRIYPNPSSDICSVSVSISHPGKYKLIIMDILGNATVVQNSTYFDRGNHEFQIDTRNLPSGKYLVQIGNENVSMVGELILNK